MQVDFSLKKVIVIGAPFRDEVLRRARKVDRKAQWWPAPPPAPAPAKEESKKEEKKVEKKEEKKEDKKEEKKEEKKDETGEKTESKEEKKEDKKEEKKEEKEDKKGGGDGKPKVEATLQQYPPFEYMPVSRYPSFDYHPSQAYNPLLPYNPYPYSRQVFYDWPHFRTAEGAQAAFVPPRKPVPYQSVSDLWNIFQPP